MAGISRKSLGAVRFDMNESPSTPPLSRKRRSIAAQKNEEENMEENDDEAERLARRERSEIGSTSTPATSTSDRRQSTFGLSAISNLSAVEMSNQIAQCIKMSAENKINDKNAFQLKMIDFLVYALKKQDPNMTNLQMATASLDASAKIYGFRVDKVHSDLLKILGMVKQDKRNHQDENVEGEDLDQPNDNRNEHQRKKKKKSRQHIISTVESLQGNVVTYDCFSLIKCNRDTQTSDMLFQAGLPLHANQGIAINLYNDVLLDKVPQNNQKSIKYHVPIIEDFTQNKISPSYAAFKFLDWSPEDDDNDDNDVEQKEGDKSQELNDGEYHFDLDAAVTDDVDDNNDVMMDCGDAYEERCDRMAHNNQPTENIVDFRDIIANNPNPNATYEYSYIQKSYRIFWAGPSHWKIALNKNLGGSRVVETCKQNAVKKKKEIDLMYANDVKDEIDLKFEQTNRQTKLSSKTTKSIWSEEKVAFPQNVHYDIKKFNFFFNKPTEGLKFSHDDRLENENVFNDERDDHHDLSNNNDTDDHDNFADINDDDRFVNDQHPTFTQESVLTQNQGGFIGDNLVSVPKLTDKIFIPYSQRAKKIDMRQLKKAIWKIMNKNSKEIEKENFDITQATGIENNKDPENKPFSDMYLKLPKMLSKQNSESLSPAIAFVTLLHLANEKGVKIDKNNDLSDVILTH